MWQKGESEYQDMDLGEIQELRNTTLETLTEDSLMEMSVSEQMPTDEEDTLEVSENKWSLHNLAEGFQLLKIVFDFFFFNTWTLFYDMALKLEQMVGRLALYRNIFRERRKQESQKLKCIPIKLHWVCA